MKKIIIMFFFVSLAAMADDKTGKKMSLLDAARLDAAIAHEASIYSRHQQQAKEESALYEKIVIEICKRNGIDRAKLGSEIGVNVDTGEIQRSPRKE